MARLLLGLFLIALPVLELALLIKTGQVVGLWPTLAMVVGAGVLGAVIMSRQGMSVARRTREAIAQGRPPVGPVLDGAFLLLPDKEAIRGTILRALAPRPTPEPAATPVPGLGHAIAQIN